MKILDATVLIAFLREMDYPEGLRSLSQRHRLVVPRAVVLEVCKPPAAQRLKQLIGELVLVEERPPEGEVQRLRDQFIDLGPGEVECVALALDAAASETNYVVTDDRAVRRRFPQIRFVWTEELLRYMVSRRLLDGVRVEGLLSKLSKSTFYSKGRHNDHAASHRESL